MNFELTEEQKALQESVRDWLASRVGLADIRERVAAGNEIHFEKQLWQEAVKLGWLGITTPEELGGLGLGMREACLVSEAFGEALAPPDISRTIAAIESIRLLATRDQQQDWLPRMVEVEAPVDVSIARPGGRWDLTDVNVRTDDLGQLHGDAGFLLSSASHLLIAVDHGERVSFHMVDTAQDAVTLEPAQATDPTISLARVFLDGALSEPLGKSGLEGSQDVLQRTTLLSTFSLIGTIGRAIEQTSEYLKTRHQFGKPIGSFQALQHDMAELHVGHCLAKQCATYAAEATDADSADKELMTMVAADKASELAKEVAEAVIQFHGAIGFTWEHEAHLFFKRLYHDAYIYGDSSWHREMIAKATVDATQ